MKFPRFTQQNAQPVDPDGAPAPSRTGAIAGVAAALALAAPIGWAYWQFAVADELLGGLGGVRIAVRSSYDHARGYGPEGSSPLTAGGPVQWPQPGWHEMGEGAYAAGSGTRLAIASRGRTFEVTLSQLAPMVCRLVARSLDGGWVEVRINGIPASAASAGGLFSRDCGWWGTQTIALTSSG